MPDEVKDEGSKGEEEQGALPTPEISAGSKDAGSAQPGIDVDALAEKLAPKIDEAVDRRFKSSTDRRWDRFDKTVEEMRGIIEMSGGDPDKVKGALREQELEQRLEALEGSEGDRGGSSPTDLEAVAAKILSTAGIKFDDEVVTDWANQNFVTERDAVEALSKTVAKKVKQDAGVPAAAAAGQSGSAAVGSDDVDAIAKELSDLQHSSDPFSLENMARRAELHQKLNELDPQVNIDEVIPDFGDLHRGPY